MTSAGEKKIMCVVYMQNYQTVRKHQKTLHICSLPNISLKYL